LPIADFQLQILAELPQPRNRLRLGVAREVASDAFGQESLASTLATTGEGGASAFGPHASAKTVLLLSCALGSL